MKIYIMTDMEGVCGVVNHDDWVLPTGRFYDEGRRLLSEEINAAVRGFFAAGATEILVADGHGAGGINQSLLDRRTLYARHRGFPFALDASFDAIAHVGQHAKAGTEYAHIAHTGWFDVRDYRVNGVSLGEFGQMALLAATMGIPAIFGCGDAAFCAEAEALVPSIETVTVKWGLTPGSGDECSYEEYRARNLSAIHLHPERARELIEEGARRALTRLREQRESFPLLDIRPPFTEWYAYRATGERPAYEATAEGDEYLTVLRAPKKPSGKDADSGRA